MDQPRQEEQQSAPCGLPEGKILTCLLDGLLALDSSVQCKTKVGFGSSSEKRDSGRLCLCKFLQKEEFLSSGLSFAEISYLYSWSTTGIHGIG